MRAHYVGISVLAFHPLDSTPANPFGPTKTSCNGQEFPEFNVQRQGFQYHFRLPNLKEEAPGQ